MCTEYIQQRGRLSFSQVVYSTSNLRISEISVVYNIWCFWCSCHANKRSHDTQQQHEHELFTLKTRIHVADS